MFEAAGLWDDTYLGERHAWLFAVLELLRPRAKRLDDFVAQGRFFFADAIEYDPQAVRKYLARRMAEHLRGVEAALCRDVEFDPVSIEAALRAGARARSVKAATLIHAIRVAMTGKTVSPGLFEVVALLGRTGSARGSAAAAQLASTTRVPEQFPSISSRTSR